MKFIKYTKFTGQEADGISMEDLMRALSDFLLQSGFESQYYSMYEMDPERSMEQLKDAIRQALQDEEMFPDQRLREMAGEDLEQLLNQLVERMQQEGYISVDQPFDKDRSPNQPQNQRGGVGKAGRETKARFELTDKSLD